MRLFLAGAETWSHVLDVAKYPYRLGTVAYLGARELPPAQYDPTNGIHWLLDSGVFTLMKDSATLTLQDAREYSRRYLEQVARMGWKHPIVECDMQRVLGVEETWKLRAEFFDQSGLEVMHVWHLPDGEAGLERMAARYDYIGFGLPELKRCAQGNYRALLLAALARVRATNPKARVHLLGTADSQLLQLPIYSCDISSWIGSMQYGTG